jgi:hypothetical protein
VPFISLDECPQCDETFFLSHFLVSPFFLTVKIWPKGKIQNESFFGGSFKSPKVGLKKKLWGFHIWFSLFSQE